MTVLGRPEYLAFAEWTIAGITTRIGTVTELRGGNWYEGVMRAPPELAQQFQDAMGLQRSRDVTLTIADGAGGTYRTLATSGSLDNVTVLVTLVMRHTPVGGMPTEIVQQQTLTCTAKGITREHATLKLVDLEDEKLKAVYPSRQWLASDFTGLNDRDAGRAVPYAVGTALKLPVPQLRPDALAGQWWFGVAEGTPFTVPITGVTPGLNRINFAAVADIADRVRAGQVVLISGSTATDGRYTVLAFTTTQITVSPAVVASTGGVLRFMPHPLTVYRGGRVVATNEYEVHHLFDAGTVVNGDFLAGATGWTRWYWTTGGGFVNGSQSGASSITFATGSVTINNVGAADYAFLQQYGGAGHKGGVYAVQVTVAAGVTDAVVTADGPPIMSQRCPAGRTTTVILVNGSAGAAMSFGIGTWNNTGTVTITRVRFIPLNATLLRFVREQLDFQGNPYTIEADVQGVDSRNAADEVQRLLTHVGLTPDTASFANARIVASGARMLVDCDYGRASQRRVSAILDDHLALLRGGMQRTETGSYAVWQDAAVKAPASIYDESLGDRIQVDSADFPASVKSIAVRYRPASRSPGELQERRERDVTGGTQGVQSPRDMPYLRDHEAADRLACYRALREQYNATSRVTVYGTQHVVGQRVDITSPLLWPSSRAWLVRGVVRLPNGNELDLIEYAGAIYTYTPASSAIDAVDTYQPDYSQTPPAAPSAMTITAGGALAAQDGTVSSRIVVQATPPSVNWSEVWFAVVHNVTGETLRVQGDIAGSVATASIGGLRAGEVYQLKSFAINAFNVSGVVQSTFNAVAIGGGSAVTTFTAPGYATLPPDVTFINRAQGTGRLINVNWNAVIVAADDIAEYVLERTAGAGYVEVWRGRALSYVDRDVEYGTTYTYRVKARNRWGSVSANWRTGSPLLLARNVSGGGSGDIMDTTVQTVNRTAVTTFSVNVPMSGVFRNTTSAAHGMGKTPIACVVGSDYDVIGSIHSIDTVNIVARATFFANGATESANGPGAHTHNLQRSPSPGGSYTVSYVFW